MDVLRKWALGAGAPGADRTAPLRATVGLVFVISGLMKLLFENQGAARFARIGMPSPAALATFVAAVEIVAGAMLVVGCLTRLAALPLVIDMLVAIASTKLPLLVGAGPEPLGAAPKTGLWAFAYQARLDVTMLVACATLVAIGSGASSVDAWLRRRVRGAGAPDPG